MWEGAGWLIAGLASFALPLVVAARPATKLSAPEFWVRVAIVQSSKLGLDHGRGRLHVARPLY